MNAIRPSKSQTRPGESRRVAPEKKSRPRPRHPHRLIALETTAKLTVNILISTAAVAALVQLLPYQWLQQQKLHEINAEVSQLEGHVNHLRSDFNRYFDPQQAKNIMQEQSHRVDPTQRQVIWLRQHRASEQAVSSP